MKNPKMLLIVCLCLALLSCARTYGQTAKAKQKQPIPQTKRPSLQQKALSLCAGLKSDQQKARRIYDWIVDNVEYDYAALASRNIPKSAYVAEMVYTGKKGVCEGYANLYQKMCETVGLQCLKIMGRA